MRKPTTKNKKGVCIMQKQIDGQLSFDDILAQLEAEEQ